MNFTDPKGVKAQIQSSSNSSLDEYLSQSAQANMPGFIADLPAELALTDVDVTIPKLSILPSGGKECVVSRGLDIPKAANNELCFSLARMSSTRELPLMPCLSLSTRKRMMLLMFL